MADWREVLYSRLRGNADARFLEETASIRAAIEHLERLEAGGSGAVADLTPRQLALLTSLGNMLGRHSDMGRDLLAAFDLHWDYPPEALQAGMAFLDSHKVLRPNRSQRQHPDGGGVTAEPLLQEQSAPPAESESLVQVLPEITEIVIAEAPPESVASPAVPGRSERAVAAENVVITRED